MPSSLFTSTTSRPMPAGDRRQAGFIKRAVRRRPSTARAARCSAPPVAGEHDVLGQQPLQLIEPAAHHRSEKGVEQLASTPLVDGHPRPVRAHSGSASGWPVVGTPPRCDPPPRRRRQTACRTRRATETPPVPIGAKRSSEWRKANRSVSSSSTTCAAGSRSVRIGSGNQGPTTSRRCWADRRRSIARRVATVVSHAAGRRGAASVPAHGSIESQPGVLHHVVGLGHDPSMR